MSYSVDLRKRVVGYVKEGGNKRKASELFKVARQTVYNWLGRKELKPTPAKTRKRKLDKEQLARHVREHPDALLRERAVVFNVDVSAISRALRKLNIGVKKKRPITPKETTISASAIFKNCAGSSPNTQAATSSMSMRADSPPTATAPTAGR